MRSGRSRKKLIIVFIIAALVFVNFDFISLKSRALSLNLGNGTCEWRPAIQYTDVNFPTYTKFQKTIIAGYPSGDKRVTFLQLEGLTGLSARDE